jgi:RNA polymerase sigma factor (sigma-70 family)
LQDISTFFFPPSTIRHPSSTYLSLLSFLKNIKTPDATDLELVEAYKQSGNLETLAALYQRYMELVYGVCLKYFKEPESAKDAVMQIFEELVQKLYKYEIGNFKSWLYTLAKNYCLMQLRTPRNLKTVELDPGIMQSEEETHLNGVFKKEEDFKRMDKCLQTLSMDQKETVELFYLQQKCYKDIAEITGKDWNKIRSLVQNGRRNLKICMEKELGNE